MNKRQHIADIKKLLKQLDTEAVSVSKDYHQLLMAHSGASYRLHLVVANSWVTYAAELIQIDPASDLKAKEQFFSLALQLNSQLNGVSLGIEQEKLILIRNEKVARYSSDKSSFIEELKTDLDIFNASHEFVLKELLKKAKKLKLKLKSI